MIHRILVLLFVLISSTTIAKAQESGINGFLVGVGDTAPDFTAKLADGSTFKLSEQRGKVVMLQFTASWCGVCRSEMPFIESDIWAKLKDKNFVLVGIDRDEPLDVVQKFQEKMKITYPLALDPDADIFGLYADKLAGVTRNIIIDEKGKIIKMTRLFTMEEFKEMTALITEAVARLQ